MSAASYYELSVNWKSRHAQHRDRLVIPQLDKQSDPFAQDLEQQLSILSPGQSVTLNLPAEQVVADYSESNLYHFASGLFENTQRNIALKPMLGRFYPQAFIARALNGNYTNYSPFRLTRITGDSMTADLNHPLSQFSVQINAHCLQHPVTTCKPAQTSGRLLNDLLNAGAGLQACYPSIETDFYSQYPFQRDNDSSDRDFYQQARMIKHLDNCAIEQVKQIYQRLLKPGDKILDLMSSVYSHIPETLQNYKAIGLGMNESELAANTQLDSYLLHDLNNEPQLPFDDSSFDAVICTSSIEYLTRPLEVVRQLAAVCKPGAIVVFTFSTRWFPGKQTQLWSEMHPFERQGLVLDLLVKSGHFCQLQTESIRGYSRPITDKHYPQSKHSDPIFAVWGKLT